MTRRASQVHPTTGKHIRFVAVQSVDSKSRATVRALSGPLRGTTYTVPARNLRETR